MRYHISPADGFPRVCNAEKKECPIHSTHYDSKEEAIKAIEETLSQLHGLPTLSRKTETDIPFYKTMDKLEGKKNIREDNFPQIIKEAFPYSLSDVDDELCKIIYREAINKAGVSSPQILLTEMIPYAKIIESVRTHSLESIDTDETKSHGLTGAFYAFRKQPKMNQNDGQKVLEESFPNANRGLSEETKNLIFLSAYDRCSESGWSEVVEEYYSLIQIAGYAKELKPLPKYYGNPRNAEELVERISTYDIEDLEVEKERLENLKAQEDLESSSYEALGEMIKVVSMAITARH